MEAISLKGAWQYLPVAPNDKTDYSQADASHWKTMQLPQHWELAGLRQDGVVWFRRHFEMPPNDECSVWWLEFEGVDYQCDVWLNGHLVGSHTGYFGRFRWDVTEWVAVGTNEVAVRVESYPEKSSHQTLIRGIWGEARMGGIWGDVSLKPYDCHQPPAADDWYLPSAAPLIHVDEQTGEWWRDGMLFFPRGITYCPTPYIGRLTREDFIRDITLMKEAHLNIVRVYAHVLPQAFYEVCDEMGMFVWQDFPLYGGYQDTPAFYQIALQQVTEMVMQLRHHPCIVVWGVHSHAPWAEASLRTQQNHQLDETLADRINALDPGRHVFVGGMMSAMAVDGFPETAPPLPDRPVPVAYGIPAMLMAEPSGIEMTESQHRQSLFIKYAAEYYRVHKDELIRGIFLHTLVDDEQLFGVIDEHRQPKLAYATLKAAMMPLLPVAQIPWEFIEFVPVGEALLIPVVIVNDSPEKLVDWTCKISMTGWIPSSETVDQMTYMHHWSHVFTRVTIEPCSKISLGTVMIPPLPSRTLEYQLVLQLFHLEDEQRRSAVNTYVLQVIDG